MSEECYCCEALRRPRNICNFHHLDDTDSEKNDVPRVTGQERENERMEIDGEVFSLFSSSISFRGVSSKLNFQTESKYGAIFGHKALCICQSGAILFNNGTLVHLLRQRLGDRRTDLDLIYVPSN